MDINVKRCHFHSIQPLESYKVKRGFIDMQIARLDVMLDFGYLVPKYELNDILPEEYKEKLYFPIPKVYGNDSVYLAQHIQTELKSVGGSTFNGEFSAYSYHIQGTPSLVFDEHIVDNKKIEKRNHSLSEEVCIQERIPLKDLIAISLPYPTPANTVASFLFWNERRNIYFIEEDELFSSLQKEEAIEVEKILENPEEKIKKAFAPIQKFRDCLEKHQTNIPCIDLDGDILNEDKELSYIEQNTERAFSLIKKIKP